MKYKIGLDIGITSVGWAVILLDEMNEPYKIDRLGVRIFDAAENPKTGASLAAPRREARSARRRLRRHKHRIARLKNLLVDYHVLSANEMGSLYLDTRFQKDIYSIRVESLDRLLDATEWARLLIHLTQRRGFQSNRKSEENTKETGALTDAVAANKKSMDINRYRTVGEMLVNDPRFAEHKRNKSENYLSTVSRTDIRNEVNMIFDAQKSYGNQFASDEIRGKAIDIIFSQRPFDVGPGKGSPYYGDQIYKMIGKCTFEPEELRAARATYTFEYFQLLQKVNHMTILHNANKRPFNESERLKVIELAFSTKDLKYRQIRKHLSLAEDCFFSDLNYGQKSTEEAEKSSFGTMQAYHKIRLALDKVTKNRIHTYSKEMLNTVGRVLSTYKSDEKIRTELAENGIPQEDIEAILSVESFSKFGNLSIKAMEKITPYLEEGMSYDKACVCAGYDPLAQHGEKQFTLSSEILKALNIPNPVVVRAISQTRKVINAIIREYGQSPAYVGIELARELSKNCMERRQDEKRMNDNQALNTAAKQTISSLYGKVNVTGMDIVKYKLFQEQDGICPYSMKPLEAEKLFDVGYCDIDHIVPYSISFDDGYKNKVLVRSEENRQKGNRLPMEYLNEKGKADEFTVWVTANIKDRQKSSRLLKASLTENDIAGFKERNLNDTKYIAKQMYSILNNYLIFDTKGDEERKKRVTAVNGAVTAYMRKRWGIAKIRQDGDLHHAVDAAVVACITDGTIQKVTQYEKRRYNPKNETDWNAKFPLPYPEFRTELDARLFDDPVSVLEKLKLPNYTAQEIQQLKPVFVSRMANKKVTGAAHEETIKSPRLINENCALKKIALTDLKLKDGEIENYYCPQDDTLLYSALKEQLIRFGGVAQKAFVAPFYKPTSDGKQGNIVKKVKIFETQTLSVPVHGGKGIAKNDGMIRIDVFRVPNEGYYFVPIYTADVKKKTLPNNAVVQAKPYTEWREMSDEHFLFSLTKNDLIRITAKKEQSFSVINKDSTLPKTMNANSFLAYYIKAGISTASVRVITHDNAYVINSLGLKTLVSLEKYMVDPLGNYHKITKEQRQYFN